MYNQKQIQMMIDVKLGHQSMDNTSQRLAEWIESHLNAPVAYIYCDNYRKNHGSLVIHVFFDKAFEYYSLKKYDKKLAEKYIEFTVDSSSTVKKIQIEYHNAVEAIKLEILSQALHGYKILLQQLYPEAHIHEVLGGFYFLYVFYETKQDIINNEINGLSNAIRQNWHSRLVAQDKLHSFSSEEVQVIFDSHENVIANYEGNYFYYFR